MSERYNTLFIKEINNAIDQLQTVKLTAPDKIVDM